MIENRRWLEKDRFGNKIYLTEERWEHITNPMNHPEMLDYESELRETINFGHRNKKCLIRKNIVTQDNLTIWRQKILTSSRS